VASVDAKVCLDSGATGSTGGFDEAFFVLHYPDATRISVSSTGYSNFPEPRFPSGDQTLQSGDCVRG
jgi:hypothetical protein